eukprot:1712123-Heterocapsa_arctica.AAC.1
MVEVSVFIGLWDRAVLGLSEFATARDADTAYEEAKDKFEYMKKRYEALKARMKAPCEEQGGNVRVGALVHNR